MLNKPQRRQETKKRDGEWGEMMEIEKQLVQW